MLYFVVNGDTRVTVGLNRCRALQNAIRSQGHEMSEVRQISGQLDRPEEEIARVIELLKSLPDY